MPLSTHDIERIAHQVWSHSISNSKGVGGRATDWLTNLSDAVGRSLAPGVVVQGVWDHSLRNKGGGKGSVSGRASDWVTNMADGQQAIADTLAKVESEVQALKSEGFTDEQVAAVAEKISAAVDFPTAGTITLTK